MNVYKLFPSKYVKAYDLDGRDITVTIKRVALEEMGKPPDVERKPVIYFEGAQKGLIMNKTIAVAIAHLHGPEMDAWTGKRIALYPTRVKAFGAIHDVVRVRDYVPQPPAGAADLDDAEDTVDPEDMQGEI